VSVLTQAYFINGPNASASIASTLIWPWLLLVSYNLKVTEIENLRSYKDLLIHSGSASDNPVTLIFNLLTSWSVYARNLPCTIFLPNLVLIAKAVFLLEHGQTDRQAHRGIHRHNWSACHMHWLLPAWVTETIYSCYIGRSVLASTLS